MLPHLRRPVSIPSSQRIHHCCRPGSGDTTTRSESGTRPAPRIATRKPGVLLQLGCDEGPAVWRTRPLPANLWLHVTHRELDLCPSTRNSDSGAKGGLAHECPNTSLHFYHLLFWVLGVKSSMRPQILSHNIQNSPSSSLAEISRYLIISH